MTLVVRMAKGAAMAFMFFAFALGMFLELYLALPIIRRLERRHGWRPGRMQGVHRFLLGKWLFVMRLFRLLAESPPVGGSIPGACVVVANHPGLFDVLFLVRDIPDLTLLANHLLARRLPLGPLFHSAGYVLSPDFDRISPLDSLQEALGRIRSGQKFLLFPEGTRSPVGGLWEFHAGAFKIAGRTGVPIQPVLIRNDPPFLPKKHPWYLPPRPVSRLSLEFWPPIDPPAKGRERALARELTERYAEALGVPVHGPAPMPEIR